MPEQGQNLQRSDKPCRTKYGYRVTVEPVHALGLPHLLARVFSRPVIGPAPVATEGRLHNTIVGLEE
jgi:hypothetical protein